MNFDKIAVILTGILLGFALFCLMMGRTTPDFTLYPPDAPIISESK